MRIALVVTGGFDRSGRDRIIPALLWLVERLARQHEVFVYVLRYHQTPCRYELAGATIQDLGRPNGFPSQFAALSTAVRKDGPFDVIHGYWALPAGLLAAAVGQRLRVPSVVTFDSGEFTALPRIRYGQQSRLRTSLAVRAAVWLATRVTVCSNYQARLAHSYGATPDLIPLGVNAALFVERPPLADGPPFRLLQVASLNPVKDQATLVRAVHKLSTRGLDVTLDIVGEDTMAGALPALARELGVANRITFHGFRTSDALVPLYHAAHLFVLSSLHEAAGVVLLEAAACGVPIVGSAVGYLDDWKPERASAVPPGDPTVLADAISELLGDEARRRGMATSAAAWARAHDADWTARTFETLYRELLPAARRHGQPS